MNNIEYMIQVMQSFANGEIIEWVSKDSNSNDWVETEEPSWDWQQYMYRIKPKDQYIPHTFADDLIGRKVYAISDKYKAIILDQDSKGVTLGNCQSVSYDQLLLDFVYKYGAMDKIVPCGKRVTND